MGDRTPPADVQRQIDMFLEEERKVGLIVLEICFEGDMQGAVDFITDEVVDLKAGSGFRGTSENIDIDNNSASSRDY